jgi:hypothetical protein
MRDRLYYSRALPTLRGSRTRLLALRDATPAAADWNNVIFVNGTPTTNNAVQMVGFTNQLTIRPTRNTGGNMTVNCVVCMFSDKTGVISTTSIGVGGTQLVSVSPGQFVFFEFTASRSVPSFTVTVLNFLMSTTIDTFTAAAT